MKFFLAGVALASAALAAENTCTSFTDCQISCIGGDFVVAAGPSFECKDGKKTLLKHYLVSCRAVFARGFEDNVGPVTDAACKVVPGATSCQKGLCNVPNTAEGRRKFERACEKQGKTEVGVNKNGKQGVFDATEGKAVKEAEMKKVCMA